MSRFIKSRWGMVVWMGLGMALCAPARGATDEKAVTQEQIQSAIKKGVDYLYKKQERGTWDIAARTTTRPTDDMHTPAGGQWGGTTALSTYALLSAGVDPKDPKLAPAIRYLEYADIQGVYALGIRCLVWHSIPNAESDPAMRAAMERDMKLLEIALHPKSNMYDYMVQFPPDMKSELTEYDHSVSQYGVLGMWALQESGMEVPLDYWKAIDAAWRRDQLKDGGWDYHRGAYFVETHPKNKVQHPDYFTARASMTEAGIATLFLAQDEALMGTTPGPCSGNIKDAAIDRALDWMAEHFEDVFKGGRTYYSLYGLERIGVASGRVYFKDINWFTRGSEYLVQHQQKTGEWGDGVPDTCFGILFLARGGAPVTINKLQYFTDAGGQPEEGDWNERPRDVASFNPWLAGQVEFPRLLNWQVLTLDASAEDLHSAPVLLVTGDRALKFSEADEKKLKKYIDQGGLVLFNADCGSPEFADSVIHLGTKLYPLSEFRPLGKDDTIFSHEQYHYGPTTPKVMALSNGVREIMILVPGADISRAWQARQARLRAGEFEIGANVVMYACDKTGILSKGQTYIVKKDDSAAAAKSMKVARIKYNGNWDPEPEAWPRLSAIMVNAGLADLQVEPVDLEDGDLTGYDAAVLTGTGAPHITAAAWTKIQQYVQNGGLLIVDAAGGEQTFASSVENELSSLFPDQAAGVNTPMDFSDPFYSSGTPLREIYYRPFARAVIADMTKPQLRGLKIGDRIGVFFSPQDLTEGLVGEPVDGVVGYRPDTAVKLMEKMLMSK